MTKLVVILRGVSGSGKSTYAKTIYPNAPVVSADNFFIVNDAYQFDPTLLGRAHQACFSDFLKFIEEPVVVVDNTNIHIWEFINYINVAKLLPRLVTILEFVPRTVEQVRYCTERNVHGVPATVIIKQVLEFEEFSPREDFLVVKRIWA